MRMPARRRSKGAHGEATCSGARYPATVRPATLQAGHGDAGRSVPTLLTLGFRCFTLSSVTLGDAGGKVDRVTEVDWLTLNRENWDDRVRIHETSEFYDLPGFRAGACTL